MTTQNNRLDGMRIAILALDDFEQVELTEPRKEYEYVNIENKEVEQ